MSNYRYRVQTSRFGLFAGITAQVAHPHEPPSTSEPVSHRVWLDTSRVEDGFRGTPHPFTTGESQWLHSGLQRVARSIENADPNPCIVVAVQALEIVLADYVEEVLAPAIAGWAAQEFGFDDPRVTVRLDQPTGQYLFDWNA
jgi:hypothetical protein